MSEESQFSEDVNIGWIQWFCGLDDHFFFCEVNQDFVKNQFNLYGLKKRVNKYNQALKMILRTVPPTEEEVDDPRFLQIYQHATELYGLIHARYISTPEGLAIMRERYLTSRYGCCPRVLCEKQNCLPIGISQDLKIARVKIYCPRCKDVFSPKKKSADADGAFFGTSFPYLLLMTYKDLKPYFKKEQFVPRVFGFKLEPQVEDLQDLKPEKENKNLQSNQNQIVEAEAEIKPEASKKKKRKNKNKREEGQVA